MMKITAFLPCLLSLSYGFAQSPQAVVKDSVKPLFLQPVEVIAIRAGDLAPFTKINFTKKDIEKNNLSQDLPFILNQTPSVVVNSDAGTGVGYTGISIRGTDATRINMTLNGLPYNDAESQSIYFVDLPDFASSVSSIQVQRGIGTSSNGAGAFGATMNFSTNEFNEKPYAEFNNSFGSFDTWKNTLKAGSGLLNGHFTVDMRMSHISSDGYIDRASSDLKSIYFSTAYITGNSSLRLNILSGSEKTYQAWNGIPEAKLYGDAAALNTHYNNNVGSLYYTQQDSLNLFQSNPRRYNYFTYANQTDNYRQDHYQLFFNHQFSSLLSFNVAGFLTRGKGYYEEYQHDAAYNDYGVADPVVGGDTLSTTNLIRQRWLDNYFYGGIFSFQYKKNKTALTLGGGWDQYDGKHYGIVTWASGGGFPDNDRYYQEPARKRDVNVYGKWQQTIGLRWTAFTDMQYRQIDYRIDGFDDAPLLKVDAHYHFFNPKAGITYTTRDWQLYFSYSRASHEPNRDDFEAGLTEQPKPESLQDYELGISQRKATFSWGITGYYMRYHNQLVLTGKINDVGSYTRTNTPESYRLGMELQGTWKPVAWFNATGNLTLSRNKISHYTEYVDDYDNGGQQAETYNRSSIALSPDVIGAAGISFFPVKRLEISLPAKYVGKEYLDNSQKENRRIDDYYVQQLRFQYTIPGKTIRETNLVFQVNNVFNKKYEANGYTYSYLSGGSLVTENFLFPMAGTSFLMAVNIRL